MSNQRYSPEFKDEAARQIVTGDLVAEVSERLGVAAHSLYKWLTATKPDETDQQGAALVEARDARASLIRHFDRERLCGQTWGWPGCGAARSASADRAWRQSERRQRMAYRTAVILPSCCVLSRRMSDCP